MDIFAELRAAMHSYDDWPTDEKRANVIELTRQFVRAVDQHAEVIEHLAQALSELVNRLT